MGKADKTCKLNLRYNSIYSRAWQPNVCKDQDKEDYICRNTNFVWLGLV